MSMENTNLMESTTPFVKMTTARGETVYVKKSSLQFYDYTNTLSLLLPVGGNFVASVSGTYCDFDLSNSMASRFDNVFISIPLSAGAAAVTVMPAQWIVNRIEFIANGSTISTVYSSDMWTQLLASNYSDLVANSHASNFVVSADGLVTPSVTPIAIGTTVTYSLSIQSFLSQVFGGALKTNNMKIRVYFNGGSQIILNGSIADLTAGQVSMVLQGRTYSPKLLESLKKEYKAAPHISRVSVRKQQLINMGSVAAGVTYTQLLGSLTGNFSTLRVSLVDENNASPVTYIQLKQLNFLTLLLDNGNPWSYEGITDNIIRNQIIPSKYGNIGTGNYLYELPFCRDPLNVVKGSGTAESGGLWLNGRASIKFSPALTTAVGASAVVRVNAHEYAILTQYPNGSITVNSLAAQDN